MGIFDYLKKDISKKETPSGYCPNCWGRQEYGGEFYKAVKVERINTNKIESKRGWIQAYVGKHLTGIQLEDKDSKQVCKSCQTAYEKID